MKRHAYTETELREMVAEHRTLAFDAFYLFDEICEAAKSSMQIKDGISAEEWLGAAVMADKKTKSYMLSRQLLEVFEANKAKLVDKSLHELRTKTPEGVPDGYIMKAVDAHGNNIGSYTFLASDRHIWLPPEEAKKERPDLTKGIPVPK